MDKKFTGKSAGRRAPDHFRRRQSWPDPLRGQLLPPFYTGKDEIPRALYPAEGRYPGRLREDISTYGRGGHYGTLSGAEGYRRDAGGKSSPEQVADQGSHRGKGPRGYRRSDNRILEDLNDRLYDDPFLNATDIETAVQDGEVILQGTVEGRQAKRRAEDIADDVSGVRNVENRLRIRQGNAEAGE